MNEADAWFGLPLIAIWSGRRTASLLLQTSGILDR